MLVQVSLHFSPISQCVPSLCNTISYMAHTRESVSSWMYVVDILLPKSNISCQFRISLTTLTHMVVSLSNKKCHIAGQGPPTKLVVSVHKGTTKAWQTLKHNDVAWLELATTRITKMVKVLLIFDPSDHTCFWVFQLYVLYWWEQVINLLLPSSLARHSMQPLRITETDTSPSCLFYILCMSFGCQDFTTVWAKLVFNICLPYLNII